MTEVLKFLFTGFFVAAVFVRCDSSRQKSNATPPQNSPSPAQTSKNEECDFSKFSPMKTGTNHGSSMISFPRPEYPPEARASGIHGRVAVRLLVNVRTGLVERACVIEGDEALAQAAKEAAMRVKFSPYSDFIQEKWDFAEEVVTYGFVKP